MFCETILQHILFNSWTKTWMHLKLAWLVQHMKWNTLSLSPWSKMLQHTPEKSWPNQTSIHLYISRFYLDQMAGPTARRQGHWLAWVYLSHHASCVCKLAGKLNAQCKLVLYLQLQSDQEVSMLQGYELPTALYHWLLSSHGVVYPQTSDFFQNHFPKKREAST